MYRVILVEDESVVRKGIALTTDWNALGCELIGEAANGEEGLSLTLQLNPDIVITDVKMPRMDGVEMIKKLRVTGSLSKFIILTAHGDFKYAQSALRLGVSDYLLKPLKDGDLEQAIYQVIASQTPVSSKELPPGVKPEIFSVDFNPDSFSRYVQNALLFISHHYIEDINISTISRHLEISEGYLSRIFKKETGYTFSNYLIFYRIKLAMKLLENCRVKVYEVADQVGYSDSAYFSVQFKKIVGISPSEYQDRYQ